MAKVKTFQDLFDYFDKNTSRYSVTRKGETLEVCLMGKSGETMYVCQVYPEWHEQLASYSFSEFEVTHSQLTIPEQTMKSLVQIIALSKDIFEYPPDMENH